MIQNWLFGLGGGLLIGIASAMLLLGNGRIAGISGIAGGIVASIPKFRGINENAAFVAGLIGLPLVYTLIKGAPPIVVTHSMPLLLVGGLLVGFGTRMSGGCTSGHGVCGLSRLSLRSIAATGLFMAVGAIVVFMARHAMGGI